MDKNYDAISLISNYDAISLISKHLYFKKAGEANFVAIIKNAVMVIKTTFKDSQKVFSQKLVTIY